MAGYWSTIIGSITVVGVAWWVLHYSSNFGKELGSLTSAASSVEAAFQGN